MSSSLRKTGSSVASKLTYANVVASLALFIALGGVSYAAVKLPKNSVGAKQIKKNSVTSTKIKSRSVFGSDLRNNTVTGNQIDEASLGQVPSAASAVTAADRFAIVKRHSSTASDNNPAVARAAATEVPLISHGQITIYAKCFTDADNSLTYSEILVKTTTNGSYASVYNNLIVGDPALDIGLAESSRVALSATASANNAGYEYGYGNLALGTDGVGMTFTTTVSARNGTPANPTALYTANNACIASVDGTRVTS